MTRDEILAMPAGREMDALVAEKVMGWKKDDTPPGYASGWEKPDGYAGIEWSPSTDISAAWEVLTAFKTWSCFDLDQEQYPDEEGDKELCGCTLMTNDTGFGMKRGETMPLAICRAALLAVQE